MDNAVVHDKVLSSGTRVGSSTGSQVAAHAPMSSWNNVALVESGPEPDIWVESSTGSQAAAHAPISSANCVVLVKSGPEPDIWEIHRPMIKSL